MDWLCSFDGIDFECLSDCAACCKRAEGVSLTTRDYQRIANHVRVLDFANEIDHPLFAYRLAVRESRCLFLFEDKRCAIYPFRPLLCRLYPFQLHIKWDGRILWCLEHCPGIRRLRNDSVDEDGRIEGVVKETLELEGEAFLRQLQDYVLRVKRPVTTLFSSPSGFVFSNWPTRERLWEILWEIYHDEALEELSPRARLECIRCDLLPQFHHSLVKGTREGQPHSFFYLDEGVLLQAFDRFRTSLPRLAKRSAEAEAQHQKDLEEKGSFMYGSSRGEKLICSRQRMVTIGRFNGKGVDVDVEKLMRPLPLTRDAFLEEESYLREVANREGRYGREIIDLPLDVEVLFVSRIADALELKANAFAIAGTKDCVEPDDMRESIWVIERVLLTILHDLMDQQGQSSRAVPTVHSGPRG